MDAFRARLRRVLGWSTSARAWRERAGALALLLAALAGWRVGRGWPLEGQLLLATLWLTLLALLLRHEVIRFVGPVFLYELLRASRRYVHVKRVVYAGIILVVITYVYAVQSELTPTRDLGLAEQAGLAGSLFLAFFGVQMGAIGLLTPALVAGAIAEEKERRTLEFVLATDLSSREIVLGKVGARFATMLLILLAGLPVVAMLQFFGGIDPGELLAMAVVSVVTLFSVSALSILHSALLRRGRDAIVLTYGVLAGYLALSALAEALRYTDLGRAGTTLGGISVGVGDLIDAVQAGNPFIGLESVLRRLEQGTAYAEVLRDTVTGYTIFHALAGALCLGAAVLRLRPVALGQAGEARGKGRRRLHGLPPVGASPMAWKEVYAERGLRLHVLVRVAVVLVALASFWPAVWAMASYVDVVAENLLALPFLGGGKWDWHDRLYSFQVEINIWVRWMSPLVGTIMLIAVAVRAAGSVTGEKARHTLDDLLTPPLSNAEIVHGKWLGSLLSVRRLALWLGVVYAVGFLSGGVNLLGLLLVIAAWLCFAAFFAGLGLWCSVSFRTTVQATVATIIGCVAALGGHWLISGFCCYLPLSMATGGPGEGIILPLALQAGLTPPFMLGALPIRSMKELEEFASHGQGLAFIIFIIPGPCVAAIVGFALRRAAVSRFAQRMQRTDVCRPETTPPPAPPRFGEGSKNDSASDRSSS